MSTPQSCILRAEEAERLAALVSYGRDRERLTRQAAEWRARATELDAELEAGGAAEPGVVRPAWLERLSRAWGRRVR